MLMNENIYEFYRTSLSPKNQLRRNGDQVDILMC